MSTMESQDTSKTATSKPPLGRVKPSGVSKIQGGEYEGKDRSRPLPTESSKDEVGKVVLTFNGSEVDIKVKNPDKIRINLLNMHHRRILTAVMHAKREENVRREREEAGREEGQDS